MKHAHKLLLNLVLAATGTAVLSACASPSSNLPQTVMRSPIKVAESVERLELYTRSTGLELSARDSYAVAQFLQAYGQSGDGPLYMNMPSASKSTMGAQQTDTLLRTMMAQSGINPAALQVGEYQSTPNAPAPVVVSYRTLKAIPADCRFMDDLSFTHNNEPYASFGCSQSANLAAMISDPRQLLEPYATTSPNSQRRTVVYDKYIQGESTASERPPLQVTTFESE
ncbi:pilus biogenesis lipoprotein CpaD [Litorimonas taeanensis]|uniref:Pilus biogenesis lipoprotein CpaD n=1 Tax=Litorimonas taeanensis TaxID=568099 RepID=A0A420WM07_9PROT|nr:CpaD family pilus assembly protein [Litorimonas taeanensis]RKQ72068.1 pilus biogenesis lipoprotein CpaD [Litorimonas taeanensis]